MKLVIGGYAQGKLNWVLQGREESCFMVLDGRLPDEKELREVVLQGKTVIVNHFHKWVREAVLRGVNPEKQMEDFISNVSDCIVISDEVGNGIVPIDALDREYREQTGRILIKLANGADEVVRVICGIGQKIK